MPEIKKLRFGELRSLTYVLVLVSLALMPFSLHVLVLHGADAFFAAGVGAGIGAAGPALLLRQANIELVPGLGPWSLALVADPWVNFPKCKRR